MHRSITLGMALAALSFVLGVEGTALAGEAKPVDSVKFARSWSAAIEEAKLLNVPVVVHSHGFYCGPCWGMHSAVCCNKKYIDFAGENTVEVISLSDLDRGIEEKNKKAETYEVELGGKKVACLCEFPGLTVEDMLALRKSKASSYNTTGSIPYTCIVDPWTEEELAYWSGGRSAKTIMEAISEARETLEKEHGKGIARKDIRRVDKTESRVLKAQGKQDYAKAVKEIQKLDKKAAGWPELLQARLTKLRAGVVEAAKTALDEVEEMEDAKLAKQKLAKFRSKLRGTGMEERARQLYETLGARATAR